MRIATGEIEKPKKKIFERLAGFSRSGSLLNAHH
jgi:hypothetical protein